MLTVTLFGPLTLSSGETCLSEENARSRRLWRALAYLLHHRNRRVDLKEFAGFLSGEYGKTYFLTERQKGLVKTTLHRLRDLLAPLAAAEPACRLLLRDNRIYFDPELVIDCDTDRFDRLANGLSPSGAAPLPEKNPDRALSCYLDLAALYRGRYLTASEKEPWALSAAEDYHRRFLALSEVFLPLLFEKGALSELRSLTRRLSELDPGCDLFSYWRIKATFAAGERELALSLYDSLLHLYYDKLHLNPTARLRRLRDSLLLPAPFGEKEPAGILRALAAAQPESEQVGIAEFTLFTKLLASRLSSGEGLFLLLTFEGDTLPDRAVLDQILSSLLKNRGFCCRPAEDRAVLVLVRQKGDPPLQAVREAEIFTQKLSEAGIAVSCSACPLTGEEPCES